MCRRTGGYLWSLTVCVLSHGTKAFPTMLNCDRELEVGGRRIHFTRPVVSPFDLIVTRKTGVRLKPGDFYAPGEELIVWLEATHGQAQFRADAGALFTRRLSPRIPIPVESVDPFPCINMAPIGPKEGDVDRDAPAHSSFPPGSRPKAVLSTQNARGPLTIYAGHANGFLPTPPYTGAVKVTTKLLLNELSGHPGELSWPGGGFEGDDSGLYGESFDDDGHKKEKTEKEANGKKDNEEDKEDEKKASAEAAGRLAFDALENEGWAEAEAWAAALAAAPSSHTDPALVVAARQAWGAARRAAGGVARAVGTAEETVASEAALAAWAKADAAVERTAGHTPADEQLAMNPPCPECPAKDPPCDDCPFWKPNGANPHHQSASEAAAARWVDTPASEQQQDTVLGTHDSGGRSPEGGSLTASLGGFIAGGFSAGLATSALIAVAVRRRRSRLGVRPARGGAARRGMRGREVGGEGGEAFSK